MTTFKQEFSPSWFAAKGHETDSGDWQPEDRELFRAIREALPELEGWGDLPTGVAWGSYSQNVWMLSWLEQGQHSMDRKGLLPFLAYIHYHGTNGGCPSWGTPVEDMIAYAREHSLP